MASAIAGYATSCYPECLPRDHAFVETCAINQLVIKPPKYSFPFDPSLNVLFVLHYPIISSIGLYVVLLLANPIGFAFAKLVPNKDYKIFARKAKLNLGLFNVKEGRCHRHSGQCSFLGGGTVYFIDFEVH
ncbi:hypothetical protein J1614_003582 [Plenodomus biglobosus]|nr:hypothetical protein J1614_003582 [Plenodomus biglobosus]